MPNTLGRLSHTTEINPFRHDPGDYLIIPDNRYGITPGYYSQGDLGRLLRGCLKADAKSIKPATFRRRIHFLADMLA